MTKYSLYRADNSVGNDIEAEDIFDACRKFVERFDEAGMDEVNISISLDGGIAVCHISICGTNITYCVKPSS